MVFALKPLREPHQFGIVRASPETQECFRSRRCVMAASQSSKFHQIAEALWERAEPWLQKYKAIFQGGRPRLDLRFVFTVIMYVLITGCQ